MAAHIKRVFKNYPLLANSVVYGSMCVGAEFSQQVIKRKFIDKKVPPDPLDTGALARYAVIGSCINSNLLYFWYKWLDKTLVGTSAKVIAKKLVLDQFLMTPHLLVIFYIRAVREEKLLDWWEWQGEEVVKYTANSHLPKFIVLIIAMIGSCLHNALMSMSLMERKKDIFEECREKFIPTFKTSCGFWLPAQTVNFLLIPPPARVVYVGTCSFIWINILCILKREELPQKEITQ